MMIYDWSAQNTQSTQVQQVTQFHITNWSPDGALAQSKNNAYTQKPIVVHHSNIRGVQLRSSHKNCRRNKFMACVIHASMILYIMDYKSNYRLLLLREVERGWRGFRFT